MDPGGVTVLNSTALTPPGSNPITSQFTAGGLHFADEPPPHHRTPADEGGCGGEAARISPSATAYRCVVGYSRSRDSP